ncbi:unnamed protein product [Parnassius mnemosyne]|uniref:C2H2-type domain-containing protein n=1 Tax=Parnassius mnemosyne TaxID=213953 RepID=A0AAV1LI05_9NEOP
MSATSALENNEDLENVPLVRMEDVQPDRSSEVINSPRMPCVNDVDDGWVINDDEDSNIGSMVSIQSEEVVNCHEDVSDNVELIVPEVVVPPLNGIQIGLKQPKPKAPESWPTLEILPGGVIKNADRYENELTSMQPTVTDKNKNEVGEMMYVCAKCSDSFDNLILLVKHVRWHEEERKKEKDLARMKLQSIETCKRKLISELKTKCKVPKKS